MQSQTFELPAGYLLTITSGVASTGNVRRLAESGSGTTYETTEISALTTTLIGPFDSTRQYILTTDAGEITRSVSQAETTDSSASLAATLSDESGTGAVVFSAAPTITKASASGVLANLTTIGSGDSYTIPANSQAVIYDTFTVSGTVTVNGVLRTLDWPT